jgi:hypothetical protein
MGKTTRNRLWVEDKWLILYAVGLQKSKSLGKIAHGEGKIWGKPLVEKFLDVVFAP